MPHPATMFFFLTLIIVFLSWIFDIYGLKVFHPQTGNIIQVQNLLSPEGIRWWLRNVIDNFIGFAPLGLVIVALFGIGVAQHSGLIDACIRRGLKKHRNPKFIIILVIFLGLLSNVVGDAGYIILLPIAATLFYSVGLHPMAGIIVSYVSVACGYSANFILSAIDSMISSTTQDALSPSDFSIGPLSNYYFMFASTIMLAVVIYVITNRSLLTVLGDYKGNDSLSENIKPLSRKERRALQSSFLIGIIFILIVLLATFSPWGILRGVNGGLLRSPFSVGLLFLISFGIGLMGTIYGFVSGRYRTDGDVIKGLAQPMQILGAYMVIAFFASQMFACLAYSHLDKCLAIAGADLFLSFNAPPITVLILFILFTALVNLIMVSATTKWTFMAFIFVPVFQHLGIAPEFTQCAYRIGDSATNAITPFLFYMPLVLTYMQQYESSTTYGVLLKYTWRYSIYILLSWTLLFIFWYLTGLPLGL